MMPGEGCRACIEIEQGENFNCSAPGKELRNDMTCLTE